MERDKYTPSIPLQDEEDDGDVKECLPQYWRKSSRPFQNFFHRFDRRVIPRVPASAGPTQMCTIPERLIFYRVVGGSEKKAKLRGLSARIPLWAATGC